MYYRLLKTLCFAMEMVVDSFIFWKKYVFNIAKLVVQGTLCFAIEMVAEPFGFKEELCLKP